MPRKGRLLDYGCGTGVFTAVLKLLLPDWEAVGADISGKAVEKARARFPACSFQTLDAESGLAGQFDLVFTHHVLEHVSDLESVAAKLSELCAKSGRMLHILPRGNPGSLEYKVCSWRRDGIEGERGNRFFFEDPAHVRRLTSDDLTRLFEPFGFKLSHVFYANQIWGALEWMSLHDEQFLNMLFDCAKLKRFEFKPVVAALNLAVRTLHRIRNYHTKVKYGESLRTDIRKGVSVWLGKALIAQAEKEW